MTLHTLFNKKSAPASLRLKVIRPVYQRLTISEPQADYLQNRRITCSNDVYQLFRFLAQESKEHFLCLHLDSKNKILCVDLVSSGSLSACVVHPREVLKSCLLSSCAALLLLHNHPSGNAEPSREDMEITTRIKEGAEIIGLKLLDHLVIGEGEYVSLADRGML
ncbi:DNA repair protein RadC [Desulfuromonas versatilis]|uniref:DNA repair protein RadC n=1 Tax=Desulfuromonas versatilis TaxID=2802975 RepID=A0ABM8HRI3_9BACT|nr:JAB domain-containing protein [Desulfuromonas versatilis]BCR03074.1 DNA repair protein RadC [Desulfuromonas versatilis]